MRFLPGYVLLCILFFVGCQSSSVQHDHGAREPEHTHEPYELGSTVPTPTVNLDVRHDAVAGYTVHVDTTNFQWTPEKVNQADEPAAGHAHLYVDGVKITRMYGPYYYLPALPIGEHVIRVELNSNTHRPFTVNGVPVEAAQTLVVDHVD